jgi:hypothetical protein
VVDIAHVSPIRFFHRGLAPHQFVKRPHSRRPRLLGSLLPLARLR